MAPPERVRVILDIEPTANPIAGVVVGENGTSRTFCGWTAMADAVAAAMDRDEDGPANGG